MPRSLWNGTIAFAQVAVPVKLYSAVQSKTVSFHEVHLKDGARIEHRRFCSKEDREVPYDEVVKGFEVSSGEYVVLEKDEVKAAAGKRTRMIDVEHFVEVAAIAPVFYERSYFLGAGESGADGYRVLHDALARTGRAAIGRFTCHNREYLAAIRPFDGLLALHTMRFADELVAGDDLPFDEPGRAPSKREVEMAGKLISSLQEKFKPERYEDEYRQAVLDLIDRKAAGRDVEAPAEEDPEETSDLMEALKASLDSSRHGGRRRSGTSKTTTKKTKARR
jgi:DNA end-binding protein Ku